MNRREFLKTGGGVGALLLSAPVLCIGAEQASPDTRETLAEAAARIEKHRKGNGMITVRDARGRPVPDAKVKVEQLRHDFLFGCNFFNFGRCADPEHEQKYRDQFAVLFNYCTLGFYWSSYERQPGKPNYIYTDKVAEWTREHGIRCKGHPLVWDNPAGSPRWLPDDNDEIQRLSDERVRGLVSRFRRRIDFWDVVNEATHLPDGANKTKMARWGAAIGPVHYVSEPLKIARAANPEATLLVNDYRTDPAYYRILEAQRDGNKFLFDVVGIQSHMHGGPWSRRKVREVCDRFAKLGRPLHFTETTLVSGPRDGRRWSATTPEGEAGQAKKTAEFYTELFAHPGIEAITWWDFSDYHAWQGAAAGWVRHDMSPKPVYDRMKSLIKGEWWTTTEGRTDRQGDFNTRAFYGTYRLAVDSPGGSKVTGEVHWERGSSNHFNLQVG